MYAMSRIVVRRVFFDAFAMSLLNVFDDVFVDFADFVFSGSRHLCRRKM